MKPIAKFLLMMSLLASGRAFAIVTDADLEKAIAGAEELEKKTANPAEISKETLEKQAAALKTIDQAIQERMALFVRETADEAIKSETSRPAELGKIIALRDKTLEEMKRFGTAQDFYRFNAFYDYVREIKKLSTDRPTLFVRLKNLWQTIVRGVRVLSPFMHLSYRTLFPVLDDNRGTPLTKAADDYFGAIAKARGVNVQVSGPRPKSEGLAANEINVILSNHVAAENDAMALSGLNLESYVTFGALNLKGEGIFSVALRGPLSFVMKQIDKQRDLVLLGRATDAPSRLFEILKSGRTKNLFLFPQGMIELGFDELNPPKAKFSEKMLRALVDQGFKVNLYVMTMPDNFAGTPLGEKIEPKHLRVELEKPFTPDEFEKFLKEKGPEEMDTFVRSRWLKRLREANPDYLGVLRQNSVSCDKIF